MIVIFYRKLVNKMKLKPLFLSFCLFIAPAWNAAAADAGLRYISSRGELRCGTDLTAKTYAYKDEDGFWRGIDADLCRVMATAVLGRGDKFEMVHVNTNQVAKALAGNQIDVMLGGAPYSAGAEIGSQISPVDIVYYDQQMFLAKNAEKATSMEAFKGKKVCTVMNSEELYNLEQFSEKYDLGFAPLLFPSAQKAKEAFLLNRCPLLTGNAMFLRNVMQTNVSKDTKIELLPEIIAVKPSYLLAAKDNETLRITLKWVLNALKLAEEKDITSQNIDVFTGIRDTATKNLLGSDPKLWKRFSLNPQWVRKAVKEQGNYGEIFERNMGKDSSLKLERKENNLLKNGGLIIPLPFL